MGCKVDKQEPRYEFPLREPTLKQRHVPTPEYGFSRRREKAQEDENLRLSTFLYQETLNNNRYNHKALLGLAECKARTGAFDESLFNFQEAAMKGSWEACEELIYFYLDIEKKSLLRETYDLWRTVYEKRDFNEAKKYLTVAETVLNFKCKKKPGGHENKRNLLKELKFLIQYLERRDK